MTAAFLTLAVLGLLGGLIAGIGLACVLVPHRGKTGRLPSRSFIAIYVTTLFATLPAFAVMFGLIDFDSAPTVLLFFAAGAVTALPLLIPPARLPRGPGPAVACLALSSVFAVTTLFWASPRLRDARDSLYRACTDATETLRAARSCREHVDNHWSLPDDLPQT